MKNSIPAAGSGDRCQQLLPLRASAKEIEALDHNYKTVIIKPTEEDDGWTEEVCSRCGNTTRVFN